MLSANWQAFWTFQPSLPRGRIGRSSWLWRQPLPPRAPWKKDSFVSSSGTHGSSPLCHATIVDPHCFLPWTKISASLARIESPVKRSHSVMEGWLPGCIYPQSSITVLRFSGGVVGKTFRFA